MDTTQSSLLAPFHAAITLLSPFLPPPSSDSQQLSTIDKVIRTTHDWCSKLSTTSSPTPETIASFKGFLAKDLLNFTVPPSTFVTNNQTSSQNQQGDDTSSTHGPQPQSPEGYKVVALVHVVDELLDGLIERASERDAEWWYDVGEGIVQGLVIHLEVNDVGKRTAQDLAYRTYLCSGLAPSLVRLIVPDPGELPKSSADNLRGLGQNLTEMAIKYGALDVLGEMLSKNEVNKSIVGAIFKPEHLGSILHASFDHHLSNMTFELAYRLLPIKRRSSTAREEYLADLFSEDVFGTAKEDLRREIDTIDMKTEGGWDLGVSNVLKQISNTHIRRSQYFKAVSIEYNSEQLLLTTKRGSSSEPSPSLIRITEQGYYESQLLWISRHIIAASLPVETDEGGEAIERLVVPLGGIEKVFVNLVDQAPNVVRLTILLNERKPLLMNSKPHPSSPSHAGNKLDSNTETQVAEQLAVARPTVRKYHELVVLIELEESTLKTLKETLRDRGKQYGRLSQDLSDFPHRPAKPLDTTTAPGKPSLGSSTTFSNKVRPLVPARPAPPPLPRAPNDDGVSHQARHVTFASNSGQNDSQKKVSEGEHPVESQILKAEREGSRKGNHFRGNVTAEQEREEEPLEEEEEPMLDADEEEQRDATGKTSQEVIEERKGTVADMADLEEDVASKGGGGGRGNSNRIKKAVSTTEETVSDKQRKEERDSIEQADSPPKPATKHPRAAISTSTKKKASAPVVSRSTRSAQSRKGNQEKNDKDGIESEDESEREGAKSKRSTRAPQVSKKVVAASKPAQKKPEIVAQKGKKRLRSAASDEEEEQQVAATDAESAESEDDEDLLPPEAIGTGKNTNTKKVVKANKANSSRPASKRLKPAPALAETVDHEEEEEAGQEDSTDYDGPPSLEPKPISVNARKKYGGNRKGTTGKGVGSTRKAGSGKRAVAKKRDESEEENHKDESGEKDKKQKSTKVARSMAKKKVVPPPKKQERAESPEQAIEETIRTTRRSPRLRKTRAQVAKPVKTEKQTSESIKVDKPKRPSESTPPPFDVQPASTHKNKLSSHVAPSETASNQAKKTFDELLKEPDEDINEEDVNIKTREGDGQLSERAQEEDLGGYEQDGFDQVDDVETANEEANPQGFIARNSESNTDKAASLSPIINPATTDLAFVDQAFARNDNQGGANGASPSAITPVRKPTVLVDDTPVASGVQQEQKKLLTLGSHEISSQRAQDGISHEPSQDVDMDTGEKYENEIGMHEVEEDVIERIDGGDAKADSNVAFGLADDSGIHLDVPMDQGFEGGDERSVQNGEEFDNQSQPEENVEQVERQINNSIARPPINIRPLLVPRQGRIQSSANLPTRPHPQPSQRYAPAPLPVPSRHSAPAPLTLQANQPLQTMQSSGRRSLAPVPHGQPLASTSRQRAPLASTTSRGNRAPARPVHQQPQSLPAARRASRSRAPIVQLDIPSSSPSVSAYDDDDEDGTRLNNGDGIVLDAEDQEYYETLTEFSELMTLKNQQRRLQRQNHYANSQARFEEPLVKFLNSALQDTAEIVDSARAISIKNKSLDPNPAQKLLAAAMSAQERNNRLWTDLQQHTEKRSPVGGGSSRGKSDHVSAKGGSA